MKVYLKMKQENKEVLILSSTSLEDQGVGSLFLKDLITNAPDNFLFSEHIIHPFLLDKLLDKKEVYYKLLYSLQVRIGFIQNFRIKYYINKALQSQINDIEVILKNKDYAFIWLITSTPELILIGKELSKKGYDIKVTVWDDPQYISSNLRLSKSVESIIMDAFRALLSNAKVGLVMSNNMKKNYEKKYNLNSLIIRHGISTQNISINNKLDDSINIAFAGSLYCKKEWNSLIDALSSINWKLQGKDVYIHHIGNFPMYGAKKDPHIIFHGLKSFDETIKLLSNMHIGYLPYWFSKEFKIVATTSFPGKMSAYAAAGLGVLHHAPDYTEVTSFLKEYPVGLTCHSNNSDEIIQCLSSLLVLISSPEFFEARNSALKNALSNTANISSFNTFLE